LTKWNCEISFEYDDKRDWFTSTLEDAIRLSDDTGEIEIYAEFSEELPRGDLKKERKFNKVQLFKDIVPLDIQKIRIRFRADTKHNLHGFYYCFRDFRYNASLSAQVSGSVAVNVTLNIYGDREYNSPYWR